MSFEAKQTPEAAERYAASVYMRIRTTVTVQWLLQLPRWYRCRVMVGGETDMASCTQVFVSSLKRAAPQRLQPADKEMGTRFKRPFDGYSIRYNVITDQKQHASP